MKKSSLVLALSLVLSLAAPASAEDNAFTIPDDVAGKLVVLHTNDTHGRDVAVPGESIGTAGVAALKKDFEAAGADVLLLSAGDFSQGTTLVSLDKGASAITFMNAAGYDAATLGNHEFDYKLDALKSNVQLAEFPILAANIVDTSTQTPLFGDRKVFETEIGKVGVFGLDTPETMTKAHPDNVKGLTFYADQELVKCAQAQVDALKTEGCEYIIAVTHLGVDPESQPNRSTDIFAQVTDVDLVIDGHSHTVMEGESAVSIGDTQIVSTGEYLHNVGVVITDGSTETSQLVSASQYSKTDPAVAALVDARDAEVKAELDKVFAVSEVDLNGERDPGVRTQETNLGDFAADAILWAARQALGEDKVDIALTNGGGIRASIPAGDITMNTMKTVFPFGNEIATVELTGADLLEALEAATCSTPSAIGAFPQVAGMSFTIDTFKPYQRGEMYPDSTYYAPAAPGSRIIAVRIDDQPLDLNATYVLATNDFTAAGGDTYGAFLDKTVYKTGVALEDALVNYTKEVLNGRIDYRGPQGRIEILDGLDAFSDLDKTAWYAEAVRFALAIDAMSGTGQLFEPSGTVTTATVYQTLYNLEKQPAVETSSVTVPDSLSWCRDALNWAQQNHLYDGSSYTEDAVITRSALAGILEDYCSMKGYPLPAPEEETQSVSAAPDFGQIPEEDLSGVTFCFQAKLMTGNETGHLLPAGQLTRAEWAQVLCNLDTLASKAA